MVYLMSAPIITLFVKPSLFLSLVKRIWRVKAPKRVSFSLWTVVRGRIVTIVNLVKRGFSLVNWCYMCRCFGEMVEHLLLHCEFAYALWGGAFLMFGIQWVMLVM